MLSAASSHHGDLYDVRGVLPEPGEDVKPGPAAKRMRASYANGVSALGLLLESLKSDGRKL